jgi:WD40 repeat protein
MLTWHAHEGAVTSLAFVPGGGLLSTGTDGWLRSWDATSGTQHNGWRMTEPAAADASNLIRVLVDSIGRYAAVGLRDRGVCFIDLTDASVVGEFRMDGLGALVLAPSLETIFCAGYRPASQQRIWQIAIPTGEILAQSAQCPARFGGRGGVDLAVSPDGSQVIANGKRFAWPKGEIAGPVTLVRGNLFVVSPDGDKLFSANGPRLAVWGLQVGALRQRLKGHVAPITGLTTTPDGRKLWTASADATVRQWEVDTYRCTQCYSFKIGPLGCVAVSADGLTAAAGSAHAGHTNGHIAVWDLD